MKHNEWNMHACIIFHFCISFWLSVITFKRKNHDRKLKSASLWAHIQMKKKTRSVFQGLGHVLNENGVTHIVSSEILSVIVVRRRRDGKGLCRFSTISRGVSIIMVFASQRWNYVVNIFQCDRTTLVPIMQKLHTRLNVVDSRCVLWLFVRRWGAALFTMQLTGGISTL